MFQVGQRVQIRSNRGGLPRAALVARVGKTSVTLDNGRRFRLTDRREFGTHSCDFFYSFIVAC